VQNRKNKPRIGLVPSAASKIFAMLIEHETKTIFEKRKRTLGMRSRPQLYRAVFAGGGEEFPALEGIAVESLT
jgi:hypothetical protein